MEVVIPLEEVVVPLEVQICPGEPSSIFSFSAVEVLHAPQSVCVNDDAPKNMMFMVVTLDTSHLEMSLLNDDAELNMACILVTLDTSHEEISPLNAWTSLCECMWYQCACVCVCVSVCVSACDCVW